MRCATGARSLTVLVSSVLMGPLVAARDLRPRRLARVARRAARGLRRRPRARADAAQLPRAPDLRRQGGAGRLRGAAAQRDLQRSGASSCPTTSRRRWCAATRRSSRSSPTARTSARRRARRGSSGCSAASAASARCSAWRCAASRRSCSSRCRSRTATSPSTQTRATRITGMLPYFVMMAVLYGALNAALDTTAGERERGSLEPLLMNPAERWALVAGKWGAVACVEHADRRPQLLQLPARPVGAAQRHARGDVPVRAARGGAVHRHPAAVGGGARRRC